MLRSAGTMHWIGLLLCLRVALSQGKPSEDASDVTLAKRLRYGDDGQVFRVLVKDDLVAVYFQYAGQEYAVARTDKQGLAWNEAKERCQLLGGDLPILRKITAEGVEKYIWSYKQRKDFDKVMKPIKKISGGFKQYWIGEGPDRTGQGHSCQFTRGSMIDISECWCQWSQYQMIDSFLCQLKRA